MHFMSRGYCKRGQRPNAKGIGSGSHPHEDSDTCDSAVKKDLNLLFLSPIAYHPLKRNIYPLVGWCARKRWGHTPFVLGKVKKILKGQFRHKSEFLLLEGCLFKACSWKHASWILRLKINKVKKYFIIFDW